MKTIVLYKSKTGFVKKYAQWIAEELSADIYDASEISADRLESYDTVIFGGSLHAVGINGIKVIKKNFDKIKHKNLVVFASGASLPSEEVLHVIADKNFTPDEQKRIKFYYLRGGFDYNKLPPFDKFIMTLMKKHIERKKKRNMKLEQDEIGMLALFEKPEDFTRKEYISELVDYVRSCGSPE